MKPSITSILSIVFICYIIYSMLTFATLFRRLECSDKFRCYQSFLNKNPKLQLALFTSPSTNPISTEVTKIVNIRNFDYHENYQNTFLIDVPLKTRRNGTLYLYAAIALNDGSLDWKDFQREGPTVIQRIPLTTYMIPKDELFNLLEDSQTDKKSKTAKNVAKSLKPKTHIKSKVFITMLTESASLSPQDVQNTPELARMTRMTRTNEFLPMVQNNILKERAQYMIEVTKNVTEIDLEFNYAPASVGKFRLIAHIDNAMKQLTGLGFTAKDIDEVKEIFAEANLYLLLGTVFIGSIHTLFDFLSFKNDVNFWRKKKNYAGLSVRTTIWRAFSTIIIFLYLMDEKSSLLILVPTGIGALIELWKCKKILHMDISFKGIKLRANVEEEKNEKITKAEKLTNEIDKQGMKYLSYVLYPLCIGYAVYSLIYHPHKSWYSWTLHSLVNGVYAFGFLFMCPQLFINYKMKSVAALPWRAFMYKAFNTFIDDVFAFIITMPTSHRVACFRDDVIFLIYLYQRWLYPVDKTRIDMGSSMVDDDEYEAIDGKDGIGEGEGEEGKKDK